MKKAILLIFALTGIGVNGQDLDCADFANGTFRVQTTGSNPVSWKLVRKGNYQTEYKEEIPGKKKGEAIPKIEYSKIEWINDCSFRLTYDESKLELTPLQKFSNQANGFLIEVTKIEGNIFYYTSTMDVNGRELKGEGIMYKQ